MPRILVVDDNRINCITLKNQLKHLGLDADTATDGKTAQALHQTHPYDIILLDYSMPDITGAALGEKIREMDQSLNRHTRLFSISADADAETIKAFARINIVKHLQKPITQHMLSSAFAEWLTQTSEHHLIDWNELKRWLPADTAEQTEFLEEFRQTTIEGIHCMELAMKNGDYTEIANAAHRLKAPPKAFGMIELANILTHIQEAANSQIKPEDMKILFTTLKQCYEHTHSELGKKAV